LTKTSDPYGQLAGIQSFIEHYEAEYKNKLRENSFNNYSCFAEYLNMEEPPAYHHHIICERLQLVEEGIIPRLALSVCAGAGKTEYSSRRFAVWAMGRRKVKWLQASYNATFAEGELGKKTKAYVTSDEYKDIFPDCALLADARAGARWAMTNKSEYLARGVGSGISGIRASIGAIDDLYSSWDDAQDPKVRETAKTWFLADFSSRLLPRAPIVIVNTRFSENDLIGFLLEESKKGKMIPYEYFNLKALSDGIPENDPIGRKGVDETVWDYYPAEHYINLRNSMTTHQFSAIYQGEPLDGEGGLIRGIWFQKYSNDPRKDETIQIRRITLSVDSAQKKGERNDFSVLTTWAETATGHHYLLDMVRKKLELPELIKEVDLTAERWGASAILVEDKGSGTSYIQLKQSRSTTPVIAISTNNNSKEFRMDAVAPMFEAGLIHIPERANWVADYEKEILSFPNGQFDDAVDSTSQYLEWARGRVRKGGTQKLHGAGSAPSSEWRRNAVEKAIEEEMMRKNKEKEERLKHEQKNQTGTVTA